MSNTRKVDFASAMRADIVRQLVIEAGMPEKHAVDVASKIMQAVAQRYTGERIYFSKPRYDEDAIRSDFTGRNHREVCRRHRISRATLYRIMRAGA